MTLDTSYTESSLASQLDHELAIRIRAAVILIFAQTHLVRYLYFPCLLLVACPASILHLGIRHPSQSGEL